MQKELFDDKFVCVYTTGDRRLGMSTHHIQETSRQALKELPKETISQRYQEYLDALWDMQQPSTDVEVSQHAGHPDPNYFRPRRFELENHHFLIMECNTRQCSITHRMAKTFWFTDKGLELVEG